MNRKLFTCERCGLQFYAYKASSNTTTCSECPPIIRIREYKVHRSRGHFVYDMALELVTLRLAFEMLEPLIKMGRYREAETVYIDTKKALELLIEVEAPARETNTKPLEEA